MKENLLDVLSSIVVTVACGLIVGGLVFLSNVAPTHILAIAMSIVSMVLAVMNILIMKHLSD